MEKLTNQLTHLREPEVKWPTALKTAAEISSKLGISEERILELASGHYMPHFRLDGGTPRFQLAEVKAWCAVNLVRYVEGQSYPIQLRLMVEALPAEDAPESIREIPNLRQLPTGDTPPGVYFLVDKGEVIYVGQSVSPIARVASHRNNKDFDRVFLLPVASGELNNVEGALIRALRPKLNGRNKNCITAPRGDRSDHDILREYADSVTPRILELASA